MSVAFPKYIMPLILTLRFTCEHLCGHRCSADLMLASLGVQGSVASPADGAAHSDGAQMGLALRGIGSSCIPEERPGLGVAFLRLSGRAPNALHSVHWRLLPAVFCLAALVGPSNTC